MIIKTENSVKAVKFLAPLIFLASCSTTSIDDQTKDETPVQKGSEYTLKTEVHTHDYYRPPEKHMCKAIAQMLVNRNDYHPLQIIEVFPSPYGRPLGFHYDFDMTPRDNLLNRLNSGKVYGRVYEDYGPRHSYVYKNCMALDRKALVDDYMGVMRRCYGSSFGIYIEKYGGGITIEGDNGRDCYTLGNELIKVHLQGHKNSPFNFLITVAHGGQTGEMIAAYDRCNRANKAFSMEYDKQEDRLTFSCNSQ